jgi:GAF domain-containing protein
MTIGQNAGSCGTAAYLSTPVYVDDISTDPRWADFRDYAEPYGLRSCWSVPIVDSSAKVTATFAIYHDKPCKPKADEVRLIGAAAAVVMALLAHAAKLKGSRELADLGHQA